MQSTSVLAMMALGFALANSVKAVGAEPVVLKSADFRHFVDSFNQMEDEPVQNRVPNARAWDWMVDNIPFFHCPSRQLEKIYYYRWWTYRKHIKQTPHGRVLTEFITPVRHAGPYNTVSCALGHHIAEGRWLRDQSLLDEYVRFWFRSGDNGDAAEHFHKFSNWAAWALHQRYLVTGDHESLVDLLPDLVRDFEAWQTERQNSNGLFWQYDVRDGMEESISGGRRVKNVRPTINSYMVANARAISEIAKLADDATLAEQYATIAQHLQQQMLVALWDEPAQFFKVRLENGNLSDAREAIGFIPWMFQIAELKHAAAWAQIKDTGGFLAPRGLTTAERRHPRFRSRGTGTCEWDGAVWPFATSQTLNGLANVLRGPKQDHVTKRDYFDHLMRYANSHQRDGQVYIGEYHDETTGDWLIPEPKAQRSRYYNHSTFNDLVIAGLIGFVPEQDGRFTVDPLLPNNEWDWFCLDHLRYRGRDVTIVWDRTGNKFRHGPGLTIWVNGTQVANRSSLGPMTVSVADGTLATP